MNPKNKKNYEALRLTIDLVPKSSWGKSLANIMPKKDWDKLRQKVYREYGDKCGICGLPRARNRKGSLNCHEIWRFNDKRHIQKLIGLIALCNMCHWVKHIGLAGTLASEDRLDLGKVVKHFMKVNKCRKKVFEEYKSLALAQWRERSKHEWEIDFARYKSVLTGCYERFGLYRDLKLTIEPIPRGGWYTSPRLRVIIAERDWAELREKMYGKYDNKCAICGTEEGFLRCDEIWSYDDRKHVRKLAGFIVLCKMCHQTKYESADYDVLTKRRCVVLTKKGMRHFMKVNKCGEYSARKYLGLVRLQFRERSMHEWKVDLSKYKRIIMRHLIIDTPKPRKQRQN